MQRAWLHLAVLISAAAALIPVFSYDYFSLCAYRGHGTVRDGQAAVATAAVSRRLHDIAGSNLLLHLLSLSLRSRTWHRRLAADFLLQALICWSAIVLVLPAW